MKGILVSTVLLFSLAIGTLICTAVSLQSDVCDVHLAEITHQGDIGAAAGLTVVSKNHWRNHVVWTTTHALGHPGTAETDFDFSAWRIHGISDYDPAYIEIDTDPSRGFDFTDALEKLTEAQEELEEGREELEAGEEELKAGNTEFESAARQTEQAMKEMNLPCLDWFMEHCLDSFRLNLDELE